MAHFAQLSGSIVQQVIIVNNDVITSGSQEVEQLGIDFCKSLFGNDTEWKQTSYNEKFRGNFAGAGFSYDSALDAFIPPKPYESWILNTGSYSWESPVPVPSGSQNSIPNSEGEMYYWNEEEQNWVTQ